MRSYKSILIWSALFFLISSSKLYAQNDRDSIDYNNYVELMCYNCNLKESKCSKNCISGIPWFRFTLSDYQSQNPIFAQQD